MPMFCFLTPLCSRPQSFRLPSSLIWACNTMPQLPASLSPLSLPATPAAATAAWPVIMRRHESMIGIPQNGASVREVRVAELKAARAARMKALWEDPAFRERMSRVRRSFSQEERTARSARMRARWQDLSSQRKNSGKCVTNDKSNEMPSIAGASETLKEVRVARMKALWEDPAFRERMTRVQRTFSPEERAARSERMRARWQDPEWRQSHSNKRHGVDIARRASEAARRRWQDPDYRVRMSAARKGRIAHNKGISPSKLTRLRMSLARRGVPKSAETRRRMSEARRRPSDARDSWRAHISDSKLGKTREYFMMRRELRALHKDLKLWSDLYRAKHGRLPDAKSAESIVAPMMVFRIRRYLTLRESFAQEEKKSLDPKIIE